MEQEFKNYKSKKQNEYKVNVKEESSYKESQRPYILFTQKESFDARGDREYGRDRTWAQGCRNSKEHQKD